MIVCVIGDEGAKRMGEMFGKNSSLVDIEFVGEFPLNMPSSFLCCDLIDGCRCFPEESEYSPRVGY
jgi:hypothetical protein